MKLQLGVWLGMLLAAGLWLVSLPACAATLNISEGTPMSFGTIGIPSSGSETIIIPADGSAEGGTGQVIIGSTSRGIYNIWRVGTTGLSTITIDIQNVSTGDGNVTLSDFTGIYDVTPIASFPSGGLSEPGLTPGTPLYVGATATYNSSVSPGSLSPSFDIVVVFD